MRSRGKTGDGDKHSYTMSECGDHCGLVSPGKSCVGDRMAKLGLVGEETLDRGQVQRQGDRYTIAVHRGLKCTWPCRG